MFKHTARQIKTIKCSECKVKSDFLPADTLIVSVHVFISKKERSLLSRPEVLQYLKLTTLHCNMNFLANSIVPLSVVHIEPTELN